MKPDNTIRAISALVPSLVFSLAGITLASAQEPQVDVQADAKADAQVGQKFEFDGKQIEFDGKDLKIDGKKIGPGGKNFQHAESQSMSKSVSVTTVNGRTVRKTTIVRDGKETTTTEILDKDGNVIEGGDPGAHDPNQEAADDGPWMGVRVKEASSALRDQLGLGEKEGVVIDVIAPDGPAEKAGLRVNDILLKFEQSPLGDPDDLREALANSAVGQVVTIETLRRGEKKEVQVTLEEKPEGAVGGAPPAGQGAHRDGAHGGAAIKPGMLELEIGGGVGDSFEAVLEDENVPEDFKEKLREFQKRMRELENSMPK